MEDILVCPDGLMPHLVCEWCGYQWVPEFIYESNNKIIENINSKIIPQLEYAIEELEAGKYKDAYERLNYLTMEIETGLIQSQKVIYNE